MRYELIFESIFGELQTAKKYPISKLIGRLMVPNLTDQNSVIETASRYVADFCTHTLEQIQE